MEIVLIGYEKFLIFDSLFGDLNNSQKEIFLSTGIQQSMKKLVIELDITIKK